MKRVMVVDIGAASVAAAEFIDAGKGRQPKVVAAAEVPVRECDDAGVGGDQNVVAALRELMAAIGSKGGKAVLVVSPQMVFPRYVKLPPVSKDKLDQIIRYEAEQNVPFPMEEVVWNHRLIGDQSDGQQHVLLLAAKDDNARRTCECAAAAGLKPVMLTAGGVPLCDLLSPLSSGGCQMLMDVGARCATIGFVEGGRMFCRTIPVAGNAITQELMRELGVPFAEAEDMKIRHAKVGVGVEPPAADGPVADRVSKVVRSVVVRLHAEISRTINFYRSQQGGSMPSAVWTCGGTSRIPGFGEFFSSKLGGIPVKPLGWGGYVEPAEGIKEPVKAAMLAGVALSCLGQRQPIIDIMPPRRKPLSRGERELRRNKVAMVVRTAGVLLSILVVGVIGMLMLIDKRGGGRKADGSEPASRRTVEASRDSVALDEAPATTQGRILAVFDDRPAGVELSGVKVTSSPRASFRRDVSVSAEGTVSGNVDAGLQWVNAAADRLSRMGMSVGVDVSLSKDGVRSFVIRASR